MSNLIIREARLADMSILLEYEQGVIDYERAFNKDLREKDAKYYDLKSLITSDQSVVFVGEINGKVIATGYVLIKKGLPQFTYKYYTYLGFMYVHPDYRGRGYNAKIIQATKDWSKKGISNTYAYKYIPKINRPLKPMKN